MLCLSIGKDRLKVPIDKDRFKVPLVWLTEGYILEPGCTPLEHWLLVMGGTTGSHAV